MFQSYTSGADTSAGPNRLENLRKAMQKQGVTAFLIPHADEHQNEYQPARAQRLAWLTGFTGSAGFAIATLETAAVFADGRYTIQVKEQIDETAFVAESLMDNPPAKWIEANIVKGDIIAYDPWLITINGLKQFEKAAKKAGAKLKETENLIDQIWSDQPQAPMGNVSLHDISFAGNPADEKITEIQKVIKDNDCDYTLLTDPASLAWLFNIRGSDVVHNPLALGFAIVPAAGKPILFMDAQKLSNKVGTYLDKVSEILAPESLTETLSNFASKKTALCDPNLVPVMLVQLIEKSGGEIVHGRDPVILPRAIKNETEQEGARQAHIRDGVAMCKFLCWLDTQKPNSITEIDAAQKLEKIRTENAKAFGFELKEISFDTISGSGPNGAIVHYRVSEESNRTLGDGELYLCDSGGQYDDGTTDITRTIAIGTPPKESVTDFTLVLKGHIALAQARFPKGTRGVDIDVLARNALWQHGKDYAHGTGHGVGSYMNVHEGPQSISKRGMEVLQPGMIISNEPGFYVEGEYGIRIENLVIVSEAEEIGGNISTHAFETITLCPIDLSLVDIKLLNNTERAWLNAYHTRVRDTLSPHLRGVDLTWLDEATVHI